MVRMFKKRLKTIFFVLMILQKSRLQFIQCFCKKLCISLSFVFDSFTDGILRHFLYVISIISKSVFAKLRKKKFFLSLLTLQTLK